MKGAFQSEPITPGTYEGNLRGLPTARAWSPGEPTREVPRRTYPRQGRYDSQRIGSDVGQRDPLLDLQASARTESADRIFSSPVLNIAGINFTGALPPDTVGDVGPNHYIQMVNSSRVQIFNKTGTVLAGPFVLHSLWTLGGACASGLGDPIVLYDGLADRWLMSELASTGNHLCVYVSQTADPVTGGWFLYDFTGPQFPDYPKYAVWPDAYYVSTNESSPAVYALDRVQMLSGQPATFQRFTAPALAGFLFQALTPSDLDGPTAPPAGSRNYFMRHRDDEVHNVGANDPTRDFLEVWEFHVDFADPANSTFTGPTNIAVSEFSSELCGLTSFFCFPQPGTATTLDPLREVVMWRLQYRNFGSHETLVGNFVTDVDGTDHGGIRWFELRRTPPGSGSWALFQEGTFAPDAADRWMGSIAMDGAGDIALGYSVSSTSVFPSIRYVGRLASDPQGQLPQGEHTLIAGGASQTTTTRWGDYSSMNVDPSDDCTFWYTNEYIPSGTGDWATRIGSFRFPSCLDLSVSKTDSPDPITPGQSLTYTLTVANSGPATATGVVLTDNLPTGVTFISATPSQGTCSHSGGTVTCNVGSIANGASATVTIIATPNTAGTITNSASVTANETDTNSSNNTATTSTTVQAPASGGGGGGGGCFIATAAFGSPLAAEVAVLRKFRDEDLLTHAPGRLLVAAYYGTSPPLARLIAANDGLRSATRITLRPVIWWARLALDSPVLAWSLLILGAGGLVVVVSTPLMLVRARRPGAKQPLNPRREV